MIRRTTTTEWPAPKPGETGSRRWFDYPAPEAGGRFYRRRAFRRGVPKRLRTKIRRLAKRAARRG